MRKTINLNSNWLFEINGKSETVNLPHCFNAADGNTPDYIRTRCSYTKELEALEGNAFLLVEGANSVTEVAVNGKVINTHKGGYSAFVTDLTPYIKNGCTIKIYVDNSDYDDVYPSSADFTFWGGIYRNVSLIVTENAHFSFSDYFSCGVYATPKKEDDKWTLGVKCIVDNMTPEMRIRYTLLDNNGAVYAQLESAETEVILDCKSPVLWNGMENPYLYTLKCELVENAETLDTVTQRVGFRTVEIDSEKGCFLNGNYLKLKGVSRHQDRKGMGNAITEREHREDLELILSIGANSVRLAHYQQNKYFYDLCDERGVLVWAEAPVISSFSPLKQDNAKRQLTELVKQNYNHPCIFCWGIENEITQNIKNSKNKSLVPCIKELNDLVKSLDSTRFTTCAQLSILSEESPLNRITDILGYNHYFGWYDFGFDFLNKWLDNFHLDYPSVKLCLSEYGAEGLVNLHSASPSQGDYSEEYQCRFHEEYIKAISSRDWLWGSYVWNMFDFGAANRHEGGVIGKNNKGLVTYDRQIKKDSYYLYKAFWSDEPFTHICGERFRTRKAGLYDIKVYSNRREVSLTVNGKVYTKSGEKIFVFPDIEIVKGENKLMAGEHGIVIIGADETDPSYSITAEESFVRNWEKKSGEESENYLTPESTVMELVNSHDAHIMVKGKLGKDLLNNPLLRLIYPVKIKTALKITRCFRMTKNEVMLLTEYTYAIHK
ncbi:MAG: glycoside hydrolase family 2 protein [Eubacterium sp.]|nr:glycoside hydrolase family 2 protein [Eubacterium sp.]